MLVAGACLEHVYSGDGLGCWHLGAFSPGGFLLPMLPSFLPPMLACWRLLAP